MTSTQARRWLRALAVGAWALAAFTMTAGCALLPDDAGAPVSDGATSEGATSDAATPPGSNAVATAPPEQPEPDAAAVRARGTEVPLGPPGHTTVWVLATAPEGGSEPEPAAPPVVTASTDGDGAGQVMQVTFADVPATGDDDRPTVHLAGPEGTSPDLLIDGSLVFRDADGRAVVGVEVPVGRVYGGAAAYYETQADAVVVVVPADPLAPLGDATASGSDASGSRDEPLVGTTTVTLRFSASAIVSATWGEAEEGRSLAVVPTDWLRAGSQAAQEVGWSQLVANDAEVDTSTMRDQYDCHALGARDKASWNLEPWRPDVGVFEVLAARCNPT